MSKRVKELFSNGNFTTPISLHLAKIGQIEFEEFTSKHNLTYAVSSMGAVFLKNKEGGVLTREEIQSL